MSTAIQLLPQLMSGIEDRRQHPPEKSYTTKLFDGGNELIGKKIIEEAEEVVQAADESGQEGRDHLIYEAADLLYHLMVLLGHHEIHIREIESELGRRFGVSGIDEKASRNS